MERKLPLELVRSAIRVCTKCPLHLTRIHAVPGVGPVSARIAFLGESPGYQEDRAGKPFVGPTGQLLDQQLARIGIERPQVYLLNVICCSPRRREPKFSEVEACRPYLDNQLACLPYLEIIVALGRYASLSLCPSEKPADIRGAARRVKGKTHLFFLHPAAALHNPSSLPELERQFDLLRTLL